VKAARVILYAFGLSVVFAALIFAARTIGGTQPPPEALQKLHLTDCALPCWIGIIPGKTTFEDAAQLITHIYPQADFPGGGYVRVRYPVGSSYVEIDTETVAGIVHEIIIGLPREGGITLGDIANLLGMPTCEGGQPYTVPIYGLSPRTFAYIVPYTDKIKTWYAEVNDIEIYDNVNPCFLPKTEGQPLS